MHNIVSLLANSNTMSNALKLSQMYLDFVFEVDKFKNVPQQINTIIRIQPNHLNHLNLDLIQHE